MTLITVPDKTLRRSGSYQFDEEGKITKKDHIKAGYGVAPMLNDIAGDYKFQSLCSSYM